MKCCVIMPDACVVDILPGVELETLRWYDDSPLSVLARKDPVFFLTVQVPYLMQTVLWIRFGFNADTDPAFKLNADPDPGSLTNADQNPDPCQTFKSEKFEILNFKFENIAYLFERLKIRFVCNFLAPWSGSAFPIRIRIQESQISADPDPQHFIFKQCR